MKTYIIQIRKYPLKSNQIIHIIEEFNGIREIKEYLSINFHPKKKYKYFVFELKKCVLDSVSIGGLHNGRKTTRTIKG
jgi:hypothetical protein